MTAVLYNTQETRYYLNLSNYVSSINFVTLDKHPWENIAYYQVVSSGKQFDVAVEEPVDNGIEYCVVEVRYEGNSMFRGNIREVSNFFDVVGRTLSVFA